MSAVIGMNGKICVMRFCVIVAHAAAAKYNL